MTKGWTKGLTMYSAQCPVMRASAAQISWQRSEWCAPPYDHTAGIMRLRRPGVHGHPHNDASRHLRSAAAPGSRCTGCRRRHSRQRPAQRRAVGQAQVRDLGESRSSCSQCEVLPGGTKGRDVLPTLPPVWADRRPRGNLRSYTALSVLHLHGKQHVIMGSLQVHTLLLSRRRR